MRRLPILAALGLVFALFVVAAATAAPPTPFCERAGNENHHKCSTTTTTPTTTPPPPFEDCVFSNDGVDDDGVLEGWSGEPYRCVWTPEDAFAEVSFQIQSDTVEKVKLPQLTVNAEPWTPSAVCFNEWRIRPQDVPFPPNGDPLWTFSPALSSLWPADDGKACADGGPYLLAIRVNQVKGGDVKLVISPPGVIPSVIQGP
jgi:hypothetical protein